PIVQRIFVRVMLEVYEVCVKLKSDTSFVSGIACAFAAFGMWGLLPLYWYMLRNTASLEVAMHRIVWSCLLAWVILFLRGRAGALPRQMFRRELLPSFLIAGMLLAVNWFTYVAAIATGRTLDASLGYYINPLVSILLGMVFLGEKLSRLQWAALISATLGVLYLTVQHGAAPWISLILAFSFGLYGLLKKRRPAVRAVEGMAGELAFIAPPALTILVFRGMSGSPSFGSSGLLVGLLLMGAGVATLLPLLLFSAATRRIPLSNVGFIQYLAPTLMLLIGVFVFGEPFEATRLPGFLLVWFALALYTLSTVMRSMAAPAVTEPGIGFPDETAAVAVNKDQDGGK
ncbi:MAG: EamA family transporter RarD, partial [Spirochaeta sp.]|nr:EamA family transporter RarD [Spirochaeta sp.]